MADDVDVRILDGSQDAGCHLLPILRERQCTEAMTMSSSAREVVGEIHGAVRQDVAFDAGEQADAVLAVLGADAAGVSANARLIEAIGHRE